MLSYVVRVRYASTVDKWFRTFATQDNTWPCTQRRGASRASNPTPEHFTSQLRPANASAGKGIGAPRGDMHPTPLPALTCSGAVKRAQNPHLNVVPVTADAWRQRTFLGGVRGHGVGDCGGCGCGSGSGRLGGGDCCRWNWLCQCHNSLVQLCPSRYLFAGARCSYDGNGGGRERRYLLREWLQ